MGDLTVIILSIIMVIFCWILIKINDKIDRHIKRFKKLESALIKNSSTKIATQQPPKEIMPKDDIPLAKTSRDINTQGLNFIAKK